MTTKRTSLSLTREQLLTIADAMEGCHTDHLDIDELEAFDKLLERVNRAVSRA